MSYGLGGFFGDFADSALKTYTSVSNTKRENERAAREKVQFDQEQEDRKQKKEDEAKLRAAGQGFTLSDDDHFEAPYASQEEAAAAAKQMMQPTPATMQQPMAMRMPGQANLGAIPALGGGTQQATIGGAPGVDPNAGAQAAPVNRVPVQDYVTGRWGLSDASRVRPATPLEQLDRQVAVLQASGKPQEAMALRRDWYATNREKLADEQAMYTRKLSSALLQGPQAINSFLDDFNRTNSSGMRLVVGQGKDGRYSLSVNQPGSGAPPVPVESFNNMGELATFLQGNVVGNLPQAYAQISDMRTAVLNRALAQNRDRRDDAELGMRQALFPYEVQGAQLRNQGQAIQNAGGAISNAAASAEYATTYGGGQYTGGWTPRARNGGDNPDRNVDAKIATAAGMLGVSPTDNLADLVRSGRLSTRQIAMAMTANENVGKGYNNPAGIMDPSTGTLRKFATPAEGLAAAERLVANKLRDPRLSTVQSMIEGYPVDGGGQRYAGLPSQSPKAQAAITKRISELRDDALKAVTSSGETPGTPSFNQAVNGYMMSALNGEPDAVRDAFAAQMGIKPTVAPKPVQKQASKSPTPAKQSASNTPSPRGAIPGGQENGWIAYGTDLNNKKPKDKVLSKREVEDAWKTSKPASGILFRGR